MTQSEFSNPILEKLNQSSDSNSTRRSYIEGLYYHLKGEGYSEFLQEANQALDLLAEQLESITFSDDEDIVILISGKSRFVAENLWTALRSRLRQNHPVITNGRILQLGDIENAALYGKYNEKYYPEKLTEQQAAMDLKYQYLQQNVTQPDKKPKVILFEEHSNTESKALNTLSNLRKNGFEAFSLIVSAMPIEDRNYFREVDRIQLPEDADEMDKFIFTGSRNSKLHEIMFRLGSFRSLQSRDVLLAHDKKSASVKDDDRVVRQILRDLIRKIADDLSVK